MALNFDEFLKFKTDLREGASVDGEADDGDLEALIQRVLASFPGHPFCIVKDWHILDLDEPPEAIRLMAEQGLMPLLVYAEQVVYDSKQRFSSGDWVRSTVLKALDGHYASTRNTVYVLLGSGRRCRCRAAAALSIC